VFCFLFAIRDSEEAKISEAMTDVWCVVEVVTSTETQNNDGKAFSFSYSYELL